MMLAVNLGSRDLERRAQLRRILQPPRRHRTGATCAAATASRSPTTCSMWCLGNEMDGPWQIGHKDAQGIRPPRQRDRQGGEAARQERRDRRLRQLQRRDADLSRLGAAGAGGVLRQRRLHLAAQVFRQLAAATRSTTSARSRRPAATSRRSAASSTSSRRRSASKNDVYICFDEWNVWYHNREEDSKNWRDLGLAGGAARCSRRTTTSRTRCSSAACSTSSSAAPTG